ncbi:hypothetical protein FB45DRAFT_956460 [Roridomyces roridus]|nr:hypothetical protein FB45DRAFT_956460 [Roridomyces roridus]
MEPFVEHLHTNYVPTEPEIDLIHTHLAPYVAELARLESLIRDLSAQRDRIKAYVEPYRALASQGRRIPQELLEQIFLDCLPEHRNAAMSPTEAPLLLGHVCSEWRSIAFGFPQLWARLHVSSEFMSPSMMEELQTWLARSANSPLTISLQCAPEWEDVDDMDSPPFSLARILWKLTDVSERWKSIRIHGISVREWYRHLGPELSIDAHLLRDIEITFDGDDWDSWDLAHRLLTSSIMNGSTPHSVSIHARYPWRFVPREAISCAHLSHLTLAFLPTMAGVPDHRHFNVKWAFELLDRCSRLESLKIHLYDSRIDLEDVAFEIHLPLMRSFVVLDGSLVLSAILADFLESLTMPNLSELQLPKPLKSWKYDSSHRAALRPSFFHRLAEKSPLISKVRIPMPYFTEQALSENLGQLTLLTAFRTCNAICFAPTVTRHLLESFVSVAPQQLLSELVELILENEVDDVD